MKIPAQDVSVPPHGLEAEEVAASSAAWAGRRSIAGNTLWNLLGNCFPVVVTLVCLPVLKRGLGTERLGIISLACVVIRYFGPFDPGLSRALTKLVAERIGERRESESPSLICQAGPKEKRCPRAQIAFVGLGCLLQVSVYEFRDRVKIPILALGAAFPFLAGTLRQAPQWMQDLELEWLFRLCTKPRRLWRRYLLLGEPCLFLIGCQWLGFRFHWNGTPLTSEILCG